MYAALPPSLALPGAIALGVVALVGVLGAIGGGVMLYRRRKAAGASTSVVNAMKAAEPGLVSVLQTPLGQQIKAMMEQRVHDVIMLAVDREIMKLFPAGAPVLIPFAHKLEDAGLAAISGGLSNLAPQSPPSTPQGVPVVLPAGHPVLDLLHRTLEAHQQQQQTKGEPPAKAA